MKAKLIITSILLYCFVILSCDTVEQNIYKHKSPVVSFQVTSKKDHEISFMTQASWPNGCGTFSNAAVYKSDSNYKIVVYGQQEADAVCTTAFIEFDAPVNISISRRGTYSFHFWQSDTTYLDTTITF